MKITNTALILAGHGSHISPNTAGIIWEHVDVLREMGIADEVTAAFWKEEPSFYRVLRTVTAEDITIVPLFTAQGYFTQTVIPAEMGLTGAITEQDGRIIRYTRTLNEHPYLGQVVEQRVRDALAFLQADPAQTAVAVIGHSTRRNPESRKATEAQASRLRAMQIAAEVQAVYLDDAPEIPDIYELTHAPTLIAVPFFLAAGSHTTIDVPTALGLEVGQREATLQGRRVYYTEPVGTEAALREVIVELAREAGMLIKGNILPASETAPHPPPPSPNSLRSEGRGEKMRWNIPPMTQKRMMAIARELRRNLTPTEKLLWQAIRNEALDGRKFRRQVSIGPFIADFYCPAERLAVEVDGEIHKFQQERDSQRQELIESLGIHFVRVTGEEVENNLDGVLAKIRAAFSSFSLRSGGRGEGMGGSAAGGKEITSHWQGFPTAGREQFLRVVEAAGKMQFGQLEVSLDRVQVWGDQHPTEKITTPAQLRHKVREKPFRPLPTTTDLPGGWYVEIADLDMLHAVVETIYPGVIADWAAYQQGTLSINTLAGVAARQTGNYRAIATCDPAPLVAAICRQCVKKPLWFAPIDDTIPCPEPCNVWMSAALEGENA